MSNLKNFCQSLSKKALQSIGVGVATTAMALGAGAFAESASAVTIGGVTLSDNYVNTVYTVDDFPSELTGTVFNDFGTGASSVTDNIIDTFANGTGIVAFQFRDAVLDGADDDIALFDLDSNRATFRISFDGLNWRDYTSTFTGEQTSDSRPPYDINVATIDLFDFSITETSLLFLDFNTDTSAQSPQLAYIGSIQRSVPEPSVMFGLLATVGFLAYQRGFKLVKKV